MSMRAIKLKEIIKTKMTKKLERDQEVKLRAYLQYFVLMELGNDQSTRIIGKKEPLDKWAVTELEMKTETCLLYLIVKTHYSFMIHFPKSVIVLGEPMVVSAQVTDPFKFNTPVKEHGGYLALRVMNIQTGVEIEYELVEVENEIGLFTATLCFAVKGRFSAMVEFNGHAVQSRMAVIRVKKSKGSMTFLRRKRTHKMKEKELPPPKPKGFFESGSSNDRIGEKRKFSFRNTFLSN